MTQEALKLALEALERYGNRHRATYLLDGAWDAEITLGDKAIAAIKEAVWIERTQGEDYRAMYLKVRDELAELQQRPWVGLTNQEIDSYFEDHGYSTSEYYYPVIKDIEARLQERNI